MAVGSGIASQLVYLPETTYGLAPQTTPPTLNANSTLEFNSETLELKKTTIQGQGLHAGGQYDRGGRRVLTNYQVSGGINMDLQTRKIGNLLQNMVGSFGNSPATPALTNATGYTSIHAPALGGFTGHSLCFQKGAPSADGTVEPFTYVGCKIIDWEISCATGALAKLALTVDGRNELNASGNIALETGAFSGNSTAPSLVTYAGLPPDTSVFHFREASLVSGACTTSGTLGSTAVTTLGGSPTTIANVTAASIKQTLALANNRFFFGNNGFKAEPIENAFRKLTGSMTAEFLLAETMYAAFANDTKISLQLQFVGPVAISGSTPVPMYPTLTILIPAIYLDGEAPKVQGPGLVTITTPFTGLDDTVNNPIQITYVTADSTLF